MKKREAWINTFTSILTYLLRCNTDVTSLRSGTAIKAVLIYVSDYITKPALKTHVFFNVIKSVFQCSKDHLINGKGEKDQARKLYDTNGKCIRSKNGNRCTYDMLISNGFT